MRPHWAAGVTLRPPTTPITVLAPDPATTVVWRMTPQGESDVLIAGPRTKASYHPTKDLPVCVRLRIRPGLVLRGAPADELVDRVVPLEDLIGPNDLADRLTTFRDHPEAAATLLGKYLVPIRQDLVAKAAHELTGARTVSQTATKLGVSERYLRRVFHRTVGVSPKHFARISRVRSVINTSNPWSEAAAKAGYTDQSHLIADFRDLMRVTPTAFAKSKVPLTTC
ncbi:helix-turn-helix domain-containing protein [Kribbella sp. NPDC026611]|uniref:helix-turn-helix domain-containing protein n=1 Tax=Kribbella sp. NPDC026611 TaxID=3154911 RepID=UPI0033D31CD0